MKKGGNTSGLTLHKVSAPILPLVVSPKLQVGGTNTICISLKTSAIALDVFFAKLLNPVSLYAETKIDSEKILKEIDPL